MSLQGEMFSDLFILSRMSHNTNVELSFEESTPRVLNTCLRKLTCTKHSKVYKDRWDVSWYVAVTFSAFRSSVATISKNPQQEKYREPRTNIAASTVQYAPYLAS